jgi:hypothetical protein
VPDPGDGPIDEQHWQVAGLAAGESTRRGLGRAAGADDSRRCSVEVREQPYASGRRVGVVSPAITEATLPSTSSCSSRSDSESNSLDGPASGCGQPLCAPAQVPVRDRIAWLSSSIVSVTSATASPMSWTTSAVCSLVSANRSAGRWVGAGSPIAPRSTAAGLELRVVHGATRAEGLHEAALAAQRIADIGLGEIRSAYCDRQLRGREDLGVCTADRRDDVRRSGVLGGGDSAWRARRLAQTWGQDRRLARDGGGVIAHRAA